VDDGSRRPLEFVSAAAKTDPRIQGASFFFTAPGQRSLAGMTVVAFVPTTRALQGVEVPPSANRIGAGWRMGLFPHGTEHVCPSRDPNGCAHPRWRYVMQGQADNAEVVVQGAQMLFSEEFRARPR